MYCITTCIYFTFLHEEVSVLNVLLLLVYQCLLHIWSSLYSMPVRNIALHYFTFFRESKAGTIEVSRPINSSIMTCIAM